MIDLVYVLNDLILWQNIIPVHHFFIDGFFKSPKEEYKIEYKGNKKQIVNHSYNCFIKAACDCGARGGAFTLLMHIEGIKCQTISVQEHIMNRVMLDDTEYWLDWGNNFRDIKTPEQWKNNEIVNNKKLPPDAYSLVPEYKCMLF